MNEILISIFEFIKQNPLIVGIAGAVILLIPLVILLIQWKRVSYQKKHPQTVDWSVDAKREIEQARQLIESGFIQGLCAEFGNTVPNDNDKLQKFISDAYGLRVGGLYISVDALAAFVHQVPYIFLQGSDNVGGEAVLPLKVSESGEPCFYLEGLSVCYRRDDCRYAVKYNIRFSLAKANRPIEEVLEFEVV